MAPESCQAQMNLLTKQSSLWSLPDVNGYDDLKPLISDFRVSMSFQLSL